METIITTAEAPLLETRPGTQSNHSAVAWSAIIAGAFTALAVTLLLLLLGSALGLASVSPWSNEGVSAETFTVTAAIWLIVMQWISSGIGGYLTGRLRSKWVSLHRDEVFFRDTAHGFLSWALATVAGMLFLASAASSIISGGVSAVSTVASGAASGAGMVAAENSEGIVNKISQGPDAYLIDILFRPGAMDTAPQPQPVTPPQSATPPDLVNPPETMDAPEMPAMPAPLVRMSPAQGMSPASGEVRAEASRILLTQVTEGVMNPADKTYLVQLVAARAGVSQAEATARVDAAIAKIEETKLKAKQTADDARKITASFSIYALLSMLIGAFIASASAALGGIHRDEF